VLEGSFYLNSRFLYFLAKTAGKCSFIKKKPEKKRKYTEKKPQGIMPVEVSIR